MGETRSSRILRGETEHAQSAEKAPERARSQLMGRSWEDADTVEGKLFFARLRFTSSVLTLYFT